MAFTDGGVENPQFDLDPFQQLVSDRVAELGDDNHSPADRFEFGRSTEDRSFEVRESSSGKIEFGADYLTHRLDIEEFQIVYAFRPEKVISRNVSDPLFSFMAKEDAGTEADEVPRHAAPSACVDVYEFGGHSLKTRTNFTGHNPSSMTMSRTSQESKLPSLVKGLALDEGHRLFEALVNPGSLAIRGIVALTQEDRSVIAENIKAHQIRKANHQKDLEAFRRARGVVLPDHLIFIR